MKKIIYLIGAFVTVAGIFAVIAIMLKKLKVSLSIEGIDDNIEEEEHSDIDVSIDNADNSVIDEAEDAVEEAIKEMLDEDEKEIDVEITEL